MLNDANWSVESHEQLPAESLWVIQLSRGLCSPFPRLTQPDQDDNGLGSLDRDNHCAQGTVWEHFTKVNKLQDSHTLVTVERKKEAGDGSLASLMENCKSKKSNINSAERLTQEDGWDFLRFYTVYAFRYKCTERMLMKMCAHYPLHNLWAHIQSTPPAREESDKRQYCPFIPPMNDNSTIAAYLHVPCAFRQLEIRTPSAAQPHAWIAVTPLWFLQPSNPTNQCYHGSKPLYIVISWPKSPRLGLLGYNPPLP